MPLDPCGPSKSCVWRVAPMLNAKSGRIIRPNDLCIAITEDGEPCGVRAVVKLGSVEDEIPGQPFCSQHYLEVKTAVINMIPPASRPEGAKPFEVDLPKQVASSGYVYFARRADKVKIGFTLQPKKRIRDLEFMGGSVFDDLVICKGSRALEESYHRRFGAHRLTGEWFTFITEIELEMEALRPDDPFLSRPLANI